MRVGLFFENGWSILGEFLTEKLLLSTQNLLHKIVAIVANEEPIFSLGLGNP